MEKTAMNSNSLPNAPSNGTDSIQVPHQFIMDNKLATGVTVVESNGSSVVLMKESINSTNNVTASASVNSLRPPEMVTKLPAEGIVKTSQSGLALTDVGFTSLLSKHLYSTTMTGTASQPSEISTEIKPANTVAAVKDSPTVIMLPPQSPVNVIHPDILRMGSLLNNQNIIVGNGQNMPQIIYVPIIAAPPAGPNEEPNSNSATSSVLASPVPPLNYSAMIGAFPLTSSPNNLNNIVYVQPPLPGTPLINPSLQQNTSVLNNTVSTPAASLLNIVQQQSSLLNIAVQQPTSIVNAVQPQAPLLPTQTQFINHQMPLLNMALQQPATVLNPAENLSSEVRVTNTIVLPAVESNEQKVLTLAAEPKKRGQKRKVSRNKSCSSDASSVDSNLTDGPSPSSGGIKQTIVPKKIERVRKTVNTEDELNSKVSGLVSKILSQFPKTPASQSAQISKARPSPKSPKRNKPENNNNVSLPTTLTNDSVPNMMIPSTVMLAGEENIAEAGYNNIMVNDGNQHILNNMQTVFVNPSLASFNGSSSVLSSSLATSIPVTVIHPNVICSSLQPPTLNSHTFVTPNAQIQPQETSVTEKPLVSTIELASIMSKAPVVSNPAVIVEAAPGQVPFEFVQIVQGNVSDIAGTPDHTFAVQAIQEVSVTTDPAEEEG